MALFLSALIIGLILLQGTFMAQPIADNTTLFKRVTLYAGLEMGLSLLLFIAQVRLYHTYPSSRSGWYALVLTTGFPALSAYLIAVYWLLWILSLPGAMLLFVGTLLLLLITGLFLFFLLSRCVQVNADIPFQTKKVMLQLVLTTCIQVLYTLFFRLTALEFGLWSVPMLLVFLVMILALTVYLWAQHRVLHKVLRPLVV